MTKQNDQRLEGFGGSARDVSGLDSQNVIPIPKRARAVGEIVNEICAGIPGCATEQLKLRAECCGKKGSAAGAVDTSRADGSGASRGRGADHVVRKF